MPTMLFSIIGESCTEKDLYQQVECQQHEWNSVCRRKIIQVCKKECQDISWLFRAMWFAILFFTWQPALSLESEEKKKKKKKTFSGNLNILSLVEYPFLDLETGLAMTFSFNPYAVFICNGFSIALLEQGDCFYLFESHARASDGMPNVNGKNILLKKTNITGIFLTFA